MERVTSMNLYQLFTASLSSPKKIAAFRLIPIGKVMQYIFIYIFIMTIISFVLFTSDQSIQNSNMEGLLEHLEEIQWLIYPFAFVFLFCLNSFLQFIKISIFAYIGTIILYWMKRKGEYRHLWRSTLFASTVPMLLSIAFSLFQWTNGYIQLLIYAITIIYLVLACKYYPIKR